MDRLFVRIKTDLNLLMEYNIMDDFLKKDHDERMKRLGFESIPEEEIDAWCEHVEKIVIPEIVQVIRDRTPTWEQLHQVLF